MFGIFLGLLTIIVLAYLGWSIIWVAPIAAGIVAITGGLDLLEAYTGPYMQGFVDFAKTWFPVFMLGAVFGKLMDATGMANAVAVSITKLIGIKRAILGVVLAAAVLTYGGVSLFVVVFAVYPLALSLFREADIPRRLIPGTIALGAFTFTMTAIPGTPQIQNLIPMDYFGTTPMAAPVMGSVGALIMLIGGYYYLIYKEKKLKAAGESFDEPSDKMEENGEGKLPNIVLSIIPLISVLVALNVFSLHIITSLIIGILLILIFNIHKYKKFVRAINEGAVGSMTAIINTCAAVGFGTVVKSVEGFNNLTGLMTGIKGSPLISESIAINILAGATGSASGGMAIALEALGEHFREASETSGVSLEAFHRIASMSSGGLDVLPHNGAVLTLLAVTGMTHKKSYGDIAVVGIVIPIIAIAVCILLNMIGLV